MARKRVSDDWLLEDEIPPSDDPRWERWSASVSLHLNSPRTAKEIWALLPRYSFPLIVNTLSWLDIRGLAVKDKSKRPLRWSLPEKPPPPRTIPSCCVTCGGSWAHYSTGPVCILCGRSPG